MLDEEAYESFIKTSLARFVFSIGSCKFNYEYRDEDWRKSVWVLYSSHDLRRNYVSDKSVLGKS